MKRYAIATMVVAFALVVGGCTDARVGGATTVKQHSQLWPAEATSTAWLAQNSASAIEGVVIRIGDPMKSNDAAGREIVVHQVSIRVDRSLKGSHKSGQTVVVTIPGGEVEGLVVENPDAPLFANGEHVVVALTTDETTTTVTGGLHGKFSVSGATAQRDARLPADARSFALAAVEQALASK